MKYSPRPPSYFLIQFFKFFLRNTTKFAFKLKIISISRCCGDVSILSDCDQANGHICSNRVVEYPKTKPHKMKAAPQRRHSLPLSCAKSQVIRQSERPSVRRSFHWLTKKLGHIGTRTPRVLFFETMFFLPDAVCLGSPSASRAWWAKCLCLSRKLCGFGQIKAPPTDDTCTPLRCAPDKMFIWDCGEGSWTH